MHWESHTNAMYGIDTSTNLTNSSGWLALTNNIRATPPLNTYTDAVSTPDGFNRIKTE